MSISINSPKLHFAGQGQGEVFRLTQAAQAEGREVIRVSMAEYATEVDIVKLKGTQPGFVGYGDPSLLDNITQKGRDAQIAGKPAPLVIFDELSKAAANVKDLVRGLIASNSYAKSADTQAPVEKIEHVSFQAVG